MISSTACSTYVRVHEPLECRDIPPPSQIYTDQEVNNTPDSVIDKFKERSNQLKARIKAICSDIADHNAEHQLKN